MLKHVANVPDTLSYLRHSGRIDLFRHMEYCVFKGVFYRRQKSRNAWMTYDRYVTLCFFVMYVKAGFEIIILMVVLDKTASHPCCQIHHIITSRFSKQFNEKRRVDELLV